MMIATASLNGLPFASGIVARFDEAIRWLADRCDYPGSVLAIESIDGELFYSVVVPWQHD